MTLKETDLAARYRFAQAVVREAGHLAAEKFQRREALLINQKSAQDFVSEADQACEKFVVSALLNSFPNDAILGEEGGRQNIGGEATWIIDPIDGTTNFINGIPIWCVSLGLVIDDHSVLGVIYNPVTDELYSALHGHGAYMNGRPIRASAKKSIANARIGIGFSYRRPVGEHVKAVETSLSAGCEYARLGSGALGMALVADGRFDGYFEAHINAWDVAAGLVLVQEAGGRTNDYFAPPDSLAKGNVILAAAPLLYEPLARLLIGS